MCTSLDCPESRGLKQSLNLVIRYDHYELLASRLTLGAKSKQCTLSKQSSPNKHEWEEPVTDDR